MPTTLTSWLNHFLTGESTGSQGVSPDPSSSQSMMQRVDHMYELVEPWTLGMPQVQGTIKRTRFEIYSVWAQMGADPTISAALSLHMTAALGGHESRSDCIFISPSDALVGDGPNSKRLREMVENESKTISAMMNSVAFTLLRRGLHWGDDFARVYTEDGVGVTNLLVNEYTVAPCVQAFEQGGKTVGFHILEFDRMLRVITKLTTRQMLRLKMPRLSFVPQTDVVPNILHKILGIDNFNDLPIVPARIGGSMLFDAEDAWRQMSLLLSALNSQQVADSVKQAFLGIDMSGMPPEQRRIYKKNLEATLLASRKFVESALNGGTAIYGTQYSLFPTWGDKQIINPISEMGERSGGQVNIEPLMIAVRRLAAVLGIDMSMLGWADMLAGGLGDGAAFHTSAQVAQRSILIRQAMTEFVNDLMQLHFEIKYGVRYDPHQLPWKVEYFSDISASTTEAESNRSTRMNSLTETSQALGALKDLNLGVGPVQSLLEDIAGFDTEKARQLAEAMDESVPPPSINNPAKVDADEEATVE